MFVQGDLAGAQADAQGAAVSYLNDRFWNPQFRLELAKIRLYQGHYTDVIELLDGYLPLDSSEDLVVHQNLLLAFAHDRLGEEVLSDQCMARAVALHPKKALRAEMLWVQGSVALDRGDLGAAEQSFQLALDETRIQDDKFLESQLLNNLGVTAMQQEHYVDASARFKQASTVAQVIGARQTLEKSLINAGWVAFQTGDDKNALRYMELAQQQATNIGASVDQAQALINIGMILFRQGDLHAARSSYEAALQLAMALRDSGRIGGAHLALAYLLVREDATSADDHIRQAAAIYRSRRNTLEEHEVDLLEATLLIVKNKGLEARSRLLVLDKEAKESPWLRWQAENTLATLYAESGEQVLARMWFERSIGTFHRQRDSVGNLEMQLPFFENGSDLYLSYMEYLIRQGRTGEALTVLDRSRAESLAEGLHREAGGQRATVSSRELAARLGGTILVYCLRPRHSYLWAIDAKHEAFHELAGSEVVLPLVERQTQAILASKDLLAQTDATATALYEDLVRPAEALVKPGGRVFLIPDKGLSGLNFETLIVPGEHPHFWIEDVSVTNARSLRLLAARRSGADHAVEERKMLLIGNPVYRATEYPPLPNAAAEMTDVASHFAPAQLTVFSGAPASPGAYTGSEAASYSYIHFVAHATADAMNPLDSAVILSSPSGDAPYKLYAADILKQPLHAELVTISSCYGSGVRNYAGEGVVGLVWAFLRAGAHSVIGALWEVSDVSTPRLMDAMYGELLRGQPPDAALRAAKLAMVHDTGVFRKPLYWAAFQLYAGR